MRAPDSSVRKAWCLYTRIAPGEAANGVGGEIGVGGGNGDGDGAGTGTGVEANGGAQNGNGDGSGDGTGTGTRVETRGGIQDGNGDGSGDGNESNSGDGNGDDDNGNRNEDRIAEGGREAKKRKKPHKSCSRRHVGNGADLDRKRKKCRKERVGSVASNPHNLLNRE